MPRRRSGYCRPLSITRFIENFIRYQLPVAKLREALPPLPMPSALQNLSQPERSGAYFGAWNVRLATPRGARLQHVPALAPVEGDGEVGLDRRAHHAPVIGMHTARDVDSHYDRRGSVHRFDQGRKLAFQRAIKADAEQGIDDDG